MYLDDVAVDFPKMKILLAHGGRPLWMDTAFFLVRRHPNVYLDISGIPPKSLLAIFSAAGRDREQDAVRHGLAGAGRAGYSARIWRIFAPRTCQVSSVQDADSLARPRSANLARIRSARACIPRQG